MSKKEQEIQSLACNCQSAVTGLFECKDPRQLSWLFRDLTKTIPGTKDSLLRELYSRQLPSGGCAPMDLAFTFLHFSLPFKKCSC
jgi:hypothetical protein